MTVPALDAGLAGPIDQLFELRYTPGSNWKQGLPMVDQDLGAHVEYLKTLGKRGDLLTAAPYAEHSGGVALLWAADLSSAQTVAATDPAVTAGTMACEVRRVVPRAGAVDRSTAGQRRNEDVVRRLFAAVAARDSSALGVYAAGALIHEAESLPYGGEYSGADAVVRHAKQYRHHWDDLQGGPERDLDPHFFTRGDQVAVVWRQRARHGVSGHAIDMPAVSLYTLVDGKITDSRMFHFDSAAVTAFLTEQSADRKVAEREAALNALLEAGQFHVALKKFFSEDAELAEAGQPPTIGKMANVMREGVFLHAMEEMSARLLGGAVHGEMSFSEWRYELTFKSGRTLQYEQVARRRWRNGFVVREDFFHPDFPAWFVDEMQKAAAELGSTPR